MNSSEVMESMETCMSDKMNQKQVIDLAPLSEEHIAKEQIESSELWMIKDRQGQMLGPFDTQSIKEYASQHEYLFEDSVAYNLEDEEWKPFFKVAKFQRRKPKLVPMQGLMSSDSFLVLFNGEKKGPFTLAQIQKFVDDKKIALNVQVSLDEGESWIKLYEHHEFDRRLKKNVDDLPFVPESEVFDHAQEAVHNKTGIRTKADDEEDAIVGLAFMSNGNDRGQTLKQQEQAQSTEKKSSAKKVQFRQLSHQESFWDKVKDKVNFKYVGAGLVGIFVLFSAINSFNGSFNGDSEIKAAKNEVKTKEAGINNDARVEPKKIVRKAKPKTRKVVRAKKYEPKPTKRNYRPRTRTRRPAQANQRKRQVHTDERYEELDIDDPAVREELSRELAGEGYAGDFNDELTPEQVEFIERANQEEFSEGDYDDMENRDDMYDQVQDFE
jgi:hypothetical protein